MAQSQRPERVTREHKVLNRGKAPQMFKRLSAHIVERWRKNEKMPKCCKQFDQNEIAFIDTDGNGLPDLIEMTCSDCGRKHRVFAGGGEAPRAVNGVS